jgi:hypothetical protein
VAEPLLDARGCLSNTGFAALRSSLPGQAPLEVAQHLAGCPRCQARLLASARDLRDRAQDDRRKLLRAASWLVLAASLLAAGGLVVLSLIKR